jgi:putative nucleotidyltransferase with HDIG domain
MTKVQYDDFEFELEKIHNETLRDIIRYIIHNSTLLNKHYFAAKGKYHPHDERRGHNYGLYKHTKRVCHVASIIMESLEEDFKFNSDVIYSACILHDISKGHSNHHPEDGAEYVKSMATNCAIYNITLKNIISKICKCIQRHTGKWTEKSPKSADEWIVHLADSIASKYY